MYEPVVEAWMRYSVLLTGTAAGQGPDAGAVAEIHTRFGQLDMLLAKVVDALDPASWGDQPAGHKRFLDAWDWAAVYTDAFYFFAWRTLDLLNGADGPGFPHLPPVEPAGLTAVRDAMLRHPERQADYYRHAMELRDETLACVRAAITALEDGDRGTQ
ncbi:hypothetical protein [Streptomyces sp. NPDC049555]|uniref:hypothetical protein n=1 Tax=unclassified Streptomyces TaxID=2593676 RepID=UPI003449352F